MDVPLQKGSPMLKLSADRKVAQHVKNGRPTVKNAFGILSGVAFGCPGATSICAAICYAGKFEKMYPSVYNLLKHNWDMVSTATYPELVQMLGTMIGDFRTSTLKKAPEMAFRIHWDGDFFSIDYARAWAEVCRNNPDIQFWVYTRTFQPGLNVIPHITGIPNLSVYLSVDDDNMQHVAQALVSARGPIRTARLAGSVQAAADMVTSERASVPCPELSGKLPLVATVKGKDVGACIACGLCVDGRRDVSFVAKVLA